MEQIFSAEGMIFLGTPLLIILVIFWRCRQGQKLGPKREPKECPACGGHGSVWEDRSDKPAGHNWGQEEYTCPVCGGSGKV